MDPYFALCVIYRVQDQSQTNRPLGIISLAGAHEYIVPYPVFYPVAFVERVKY